MAKAKTAYACSECGASALQWFGSCPSCGAAGTLVETITERGFVRHAKASAESVALGDVASGEMERIATGQFKAVRASQTRIDGPLELDRLHRCDGKIQWRAKGVG